MPIIRRSYCVPLPIVVCPVVLVAVVMLVSRWQTVCTVRRMLPAMQATLGIGSGTQLDLLTMGVKMPETC